MTTIEFDAITLKRELIASPPIVLWPQVSAAVAPPTDMEKILRAPLRADTDDVRLRVRLPNGKEHSVPADKIWPVETPGVNATVLDDYRVFVEQGGLPFDAYEEDVE